MSSVTYCNADAVGESVPDSRWATPPDAEDAAPACAADGAIGPASA